MSDYLVNLGKNNLARKMVRTLGLPIPLPQALLRSTGAWEDKPLTDQVVVAGTGGALTPALAECLMHAGASVQVIGDMDAFTSLSEAWARSVEPAVADGNKPYAIVLDASHLETAEDLRVLYDALSPRMRSIQTCGRLVVLGRPPEGLEPVAAGVQRALEGFIRSAGKELGRKGTTANLIQVEAGAEDRLGATLRWVLSQHAAFLTCQPIRVSAAVQTEGGAPHQRPLDAKLALVTGAARGIGKSIAQALAREGAHVLCLDLPGDSEALQSLAESIGGTALTGDVTQEDTLQTVRDVLKARGVESLDILVNNAGVTRDKTLAKMREDHWDLTLAVNLGAVMRLTTSLPLADGGRVVNLSSINGLAGAPGQTNYSATKAGVAGFTAAMGAQMAERGIAVNAVAPGFIETRMTAAVPAGTREAGRRLSALSQGGLPHDIAEAVTFLCSPGAAGLCGQTVRVCGGNFVGA